MASLNNIEFLESLNKKLQVSEVEEQVVPSFEEAPISRQLGFGYSQGTTSIGGVGKVLSSIHDTFTKGGSFELNSYLNEIENQQNIFKEYPEFKGITPDQYTTAMKVAEGSNFVLDPINLAAFVLPGGVAARAGQLGLVEAAGETARQVGVSGKVVDPLTVAITGSLGLVGSAGADLAIAGYKKFYTKEANELVAEVNTKATVSKTDDVPTDQDLKPILTQSDHVRFWWKKSLEGQQTELSRLRQQAIDGEDIAQGDFVRAFWKASGAEKNKINVDPILSNTETLNIQKAVASLKTSTDEVTVQEVKHQQKLLNISRVDKNLASLKEKVKNTTSFNTANIQKEIASLEKTKKELSVDVPEQSFNLVKAKADAIADTIEDLASQNQLTDNVFATLMAEAVRPTVGAAGGGVVGNMFDDDSDHNWMYYGMFVGAGFGHLSRRLNKSTSLTSLQKENGDLVINEAYRSLAGRAMAKLKIMTASTTATKMDAAGGWAKVIGNKLFSRIGTGDAYSLEAKVQRLHSDYFAKLNSVVVLPETKNILSQLGSMTEKSVLKMNEANKTVNTIAGEVMRGFTDINSLKAGYKGLSGDLQPLTKEQLTSVQEAVEGYKQQLSYVKGLVDDAGISFKDLGEDYGLPQLWNIEKAESNYFSFVADLEQAIKIQTSNGGRKLNADNFATNVTTKPAFRDSATSRKNEFFNRDSETGAITFRNEAVYFENTRQLTDKAAVKFLAQKGWLKLDAQEVLTEYGLQTIKVAEFAKTFGAKGELINEALKSIRTSFKKEASSLDIEKSKLLDSQRVNHEDLLINGIEAFWGRYGKPLTGEVGQLQTTSVRTLQALANMKYLSTVAIANLPDLLQPFINSSFGTAAKVALQKPFKQSFAMKGNFKYDTTWERELMNFTSGGMIDSRGQAFLANTQDVFFKAVGLKKVTQVARDFAYDVGVNRAYNLSKKTKLSKNELREIKSLGLTEDNLKVLNKHKSVEEAFDDSSGANVFLDIAGRQAADRDAIIPLVGNRLLFTQHQNPYIRSMGQFLSWTMAKSSQLNKILTRVEDGDARLALKMISVIPIYAGLREMKGFLNPGAAKDPYKDEDYIDKALRSLKISGQVNNWAIDKIAESLKYNVSSRDNFTGGVSPALGYLEESIKTIASATKERNVEDAAKRIGETVPIVSQAIDIAEKYSVGGEVEVPNASPEPDERIDKMTGLPYNLQAGIPFRDEEDPLKRLGLVGGGKAVNPMQRLGFVLGGITKAATPFLKGLLKSADDTAENVFNSPAAKQLASQTPDGSVDDVAKSLSNKTVAELDSMVKTQGSEEAKQVLKSQLGEARFREKYPELKESDAETAINMKEEDIAAWQKANKLQEIKRQKQRPEVIQSLQQVLAGKKSIVEHNKLVDEVFPPSFYTKENAPKFPTLVEVRGAVGKKTLTGGRGLINADIFIDEGLRVSSRLDIPAYDEKGVWAVTLHEAGKNGKAFAYGQSAILKNVEFTTNPAAALDIAVGQNKGTIARIEGDWVNHNPIETYEKVLNLLDSDEWVQVGMNPYKHSYFYDKATMKPLKSASEVIQIGPLVLAKRDKNLIYADADDFKIDLSPENIKGKKKLKDQEINIDSVSFVEGGKVLKALSRRR